jgi:sporulation protein YlmC with PRC-barrel domain
VINISKLMGKRVIGANAYALGDVTGAQIDTEKWTITHLHVSLTEEATGSSGSGNPSWAQ